MRILFITNIFEKYVQREPLGLMYLCSMLRRGGHEVGLCGTDRDELAGEFATFKPDIVGYSLTTGFHKFFLALNQELKNKYSFISFFGGPHATFFPEVIKQPGVDVVCRGEGEYPVLDLAGRLDKGAAITDIPNLYVKAGGKIYRNPLRQLEENLDSLPHPDRELFYGKFKAAGAARIKSIITIRGCPFSCSYCYNKSYNQLYKNLGKVIRIRSVDDVILEINEIKGRYPLDLVYFVTDNFVLSRAWLFEFEAKYKRAVGLPFHCLVSPDLMDEQTADALKAAGCVSVMMGIECGNDRIRQDILKRGITREKIARAVTLLKKTKIRVCSQNILGIPGGSLAVDLETYKLNLSLNIDYSVVSIMQPYPQTEIYDFAKKLNLIKDDMDIIDDSYYDKSPLDIPDKKKVERLQKLFALGIGLRLPAGAVKFLTGLPLNKLYVVLYRLWKGYCGKLRIFPHQTTFRSLVGEAVNFVCGSGVR
jgi:anaerobic magnesium-protoporphyrin IX monomethyl ester cyclase